MQVIKFEVTTFKLLYIKFVMADGTEIGIMKIGLPLTDLRTIIDHILAVLKIF